MNLHVFNDALGFFTNKTVALFNQLDPENNHYLNTAPKPKQKVASISYTSLRRFIKRNDLQKYSKILFHGYQYYNENDLKAINNQYPLTKIVWVFWSHEYYQHPKYFNLLYQGFSRRFLLRKYLSWYFEHFLAFCKGSVRSPLYSGFKSFEANFSSFNLFCSLIKGDYEVVMKNQENVKYQYISYISLADFPKTELKIDSIKDEIMIGHSASPILNHYEILQNLSQQGVSNPIYIPLSYGKKAYVSALKKQIKKNINNLIIEYQESSLTKENYYNRISRVGYFVLNSFCQQGLGNVFFFLWTGTKVFLNRETSTYKTLREKGFHISTMEELSDTTGLTPISANDQLHNRQLVEQMLNVDTVHGSWKELLLAK